MNRADYRRWRAARTLAELAELTALWLTGQIASQPGYQPNRGPDKETRELVPVLAGLNRAGWLTDVSQPGWGPGVGYDGAIWCQRAGLAGVAEPSLADRVTSAATTAGLLVIRHANASRPTDQDTVLVTTRNGWPHTAFGAHRSRRDLNTQFAECATAALTELSTAVQITIVDPHWGRNDLLWPLLEQFTTCSHACRQAAYRDHHTPTRRSA